MLSIFAVPRPWAGEFAVIQSNAVRSWLRVADEVILMGDEPGTAVAAAQFGAVYVPHLERSPYRVPLVSSVFSQGTRHARHELLAYVNADIILFPCFKRAIENIHAHFRPRPFLMIGRRWNVRVNGEIDFAVPDVIPRLKCTGRMADTNGVDFFAFSRNTFVDVPPFALGRLRWDKWLLLAAGDRGVSVIDATRCVFAAHQTHGNDPPLPRRGTRHGLGIKVGPEVLANRRVWDDAMRARPASPAAPVWYAL